MVNTINLHLFQWRVIPGNVDGNLRKAVEFLQKADPGDGDLVILPEMFSAGFCYGALEEAAQRSGEVLDWMAGEARRYRTAIAGSLPIRSKRGIANTMVFMDVSGKILATYDKIHLFPVTGEDRHFVAGDRTVTANWKGIILGLAVCFDLRFPEVTRRLCLERAEVVLVSAQWPLERLGQFRELVRVRAMENQMFMAACNSCGADGTGLILGGGSMVAGPSGEIIGTLGADEGILSLKIAVADVARWRDEFPILKCRRKDLFG
jgi:predicted amidohydrolase